MDHENESAFASVLAKPICRSCGALGFHYFDCPASALTPDRSSHVTSGHPFLRVRVSVRLGNLRRGANRFQRQVAREVAALRYGAPYSARKLLKTAAISAVTIILGVVAFILVCAL